MPEEKQVRPQLPELFKDSANAWADLSTLHKYVLERGNEQMEWYYAKKKWHSKRSLHLRFVAIVFFVLGGLVPLTKAAFPSVDLSAMPGLSVLSGRLDFGQLGYLLIGIGAGCLAMDRYFGYSTTWMRFVTVALAIEKTMEEYRFEWTRGTAALHGKEPTPEQLDELVKMCRDVSLKIRVQVEEETNAWVTEFQSSLAHLEKELSNRAATVVKESQEYATSSRPGAISITVNNGSDADDGVSVTLDGRLIEQRFYGNKAELAAVPAGNHSLQITATLSGQPAYGSDTITVKAGEIAKLTLELVKVKKASA